MRNLCIILAVFAAVALLAATSAEAAWTWTPQTGRWINVKRLPKETPELQIEYTRTVMLEGDLRKALDETEKFIKFYPDSDLADQNQFLRGEIKMAQGKGLEAAREFQQVVAKYPNSTLYDQVIKKQYEIGDTLYQRGQAQQKKKFRLFLGNPYKKAIEVYGMVISNQPFTDAAAEAQYKIGLCHFARKDYVAAAFEYKRVIEDYSTSQWVDDARYDLAMAYYRESLPPSYDQEPSQLTINAIDEFKQQFPDDPRVAELEPLRAEMQTRIAAQHLDIAQYYERRRNFDAARIYYNLLAETFPETAPGDKAKQWLEQNPDTVETPVERVLAKESL